MPPNYADLDGDGRSELLVRGPAGLGVLGIVDGELVTIALAARGAALPGGWTLDVDSDLLVGTGDFDGDGRDELVVVGAGGLALLGLRGDGLEAIAVACEGARIGDWTLHTASWRVGPIADYDGDGRDELAVIGPHGLAILKLVDGGLVPLAIARDGQRFGGWKLDAAANDLRIVGDADGDGRAELLATSRWGLALLELDGDTLVPTTLVASGARLGDWLFDVKADRVHTMADFDGSGRAELLVTGPAGLALLELVDGRLRSRVIIPDGERVGGWLLDVHGQRFGPAARFDRDRQDELFIASAQALGVLELGRTALSLSVIAAQGDEIGRRWRIDTASDRVVGVGDFDGDGRAELLITRASGLAVLGVRLLRFGLELVVDDGAVLGDWTLDLAHDRFGFDD
jgi:hypothetical protein